MEVKDLINALIKEYLEVGHEQKNYDGAIVLCTAVIKIDPGNYIHYYNRGVYFAYLDQVDEAIADYTKALVLNPFHLTSLMNRGVAFKEKGEIEKAIADTERCLEIYPDSVARFNLQSMYHRREKLKESI